MTKHFPAIPEGCERFKIENGIAKFLDGNIWITVAKGLRSGSKSGTAANICNAARCAWLDEAERERDTGNPVLSNLVCHFIYLIAPKYLDVSPYPVCEPWEIDYAHCLAWAEAWEREGRE